MNFRFTVLETSLNRAEFQWKCLRLLQRASVLGIVFVLLLLLLGIAILSGWIVTKSVAVTLVAILCVLAILAFMVLLIVTSAGGPNRNWLAAAVERIDRRFLDRLNTLLYLEKRRGERSAESFAFRIAQQAQQVATQKLPPSPFSAATPLRWFSVFVLAGLAVVYFNQAYSPWRHLLAAQPAKIEQGKAPDQPLDLALPATNNIEQNKSWAEVRITDPGADLKVTKVDVVPLQIEAAANQTLKEVRWFSTVNGGDEAVHELPPPSEPRYAVYQPTLYLDELNLSDWDVMTYYAQASTDPKNVYASEVYFLEVRPFREDILKMPGGESGKPYQAINDITGLIARQQQIIRQTHQHLQKPPELETLQMQDRKKLGEAEHDLSGSVQHLYAKMATEMENQPIGEALDNLAKAQGSLDGATQNLQNNAMPQAQNDERGALTALVGARKMFQKAISDNPSAFDQPSDQPEEQPPVADSSRKLSQMAEFRNEAKAAQEFTQKALEQQRSIEQRSRNAPLSQYSRLGEEEQQLQQGLRNFQEQHPQTFKGSEREAAQAQTGLGRAADALQNRNAQARSSTQEATRDLEMFAQSMHRQAMGQQLADAYKLKQMLDQQAQALERRAKPDSNMSDAELQKTVQEAKQTVEQLKKAAEQEPTRDAFGQPLRDALGGQTKTDLDSRLLKLQAAQDEETKQQAAGEAGKGLGKLSEAFSASQPSSLQMARQSDSLKPNDSDSFSQGMGELDSLIKQLENNRQPAKGDQAKQAQQALTDLQKGMRSQFGQNDRADQLLAEMQQILKTEGGLEPGNLKKLMDALQRFSVETSEELAKQEDQPEVANINPSHLPPAYRGRIQKYFEKLSEK